MEERMCSSRILWFINNAELTALKAEALYPQRSCSFGGSWGGLQMVVRLCLTNLRSAATKDEIAFLKSPSAFDSVPLEMEGDSYQCMLNVYICRLWADAVKLFSLGQ